MTQLFHDFETRSCLSLPDRGLDCYSRHSSTQVLLCAYAYDNGPVELWQPHLGPMPAELREGLDDPFITKVAWNSQFERAIWKYVLGIDSPCGEWLDPSVHSRHLSIPGSLEQAGQVLGLPPELLKNEDGKRLIKLFCETASAGGEETLFGLSETSFHDWNTRPADWDLFCSYCRQDVVAEREILKRLKKFPLPDIEQRGWVLDQRINERGIPTDLDLINGATSVAETEKSLMRGQLAALTGLENTNSVPQMLAWCRDRGYSFSGLAKGFVERALAGEGDVPQSVKDALILRKQTAKTSDSKLEQIRNRIGEDGYLRYQFLFMGSSRAGRWSAGGGGAQLHNLPRPTKSVEANLERAIALLRTGDHAAVAKEFQHPLEVVTSCLRSMFRAPAGYKLIIADLNAIENRGLGYAAKADSILRVFREGRCPYLTFATKLSGRTYEDIEAAYKAGDPTTKKLRQDSKPPILGGGYRLGGGEEMVSEEGDRIFTGLLGYAKAMQIELTRDFCHEAIGVFRKAHPEVAGYVEEGEQYPHGGLWRDLEDAAFLTMKTGQPVEAGRCVFRAFGPKKQRKVLQILLPSGRGLHYIRPMIEKIEFMGKPKDTLTYEGMDIKKHVWSRVKTQGGKLTENIVQGMARDVLLNGMFLAEARNLAIVAHVHDEIVAMVPEDSPLGVKDLRECMIASPSWTTPEEFPLDADGFESPYYKKG